MKLSVVIGLMILLLPKAAWAGSEDLASLSLAIDTIWVMLAAFLVFLMHAGFTMVEVGFTRAKNAVNIMMKNMLTISLGVVVFFLVGFALAFGTDVGGLVGTSGFALLGSEGMDFGIPVLAFWFFQAVFAATSATIVSGAVAERTNFLAYILFTLVITAFTYPVVAHWIWGGGWLAQLGFIDFAGSTAVHGVGGWSALVGAALVGARLGKYGPQGEVHAIPGHNIPLGTLGVLLLWFGWFGFNPGSTLSGTTPEIAGIAANTLLAGAGGALSSLFFTWKRYTRPDLSLTLNGALGGLVGITAGAAAVSPLSALIIGCLAGLILVLSVEFLDKRIKIDDPVGAISVHGICGAFGTLAVGFFATEGGLFYGGGLAIVAVQALGVLAVLAWTGAVSFISFKAIDALIGLRVSAEDEVEGLDSSEHGSAAYQSQTEKKPELGLMTALEQREMSV